MPEIRLGLSQKDRKTNWTPKVRVVNLLAEPSATNAFTGVDHIQRPGMTVYADAGAGPVRGVFRQAGTFEGDLLSISGEELYRIDPDGAATLLGNLPGQLRTTSAATATRCIIVSDGVAYSTDGIAVTTVVMPDGRLVGSVAQLNGYFILTELNSARFYWIEPGETDPDGLSFATTESSPGFIRAVLRVGDELWFMKEEGSETWVPTGDADLPFQRVPGRNYDKGCRARDTVIRFDNSLGWVGNDGIVYRGDASPIRFSDNTVEEKISKADPESLCAWSFAFDGHTLYCLATNLGTVVFDAASQQWSEFESYERPKWRAQVGETLESFVIAGDDETGLIYRMDQENSTDNGTPMLRLLTGIVQMPGGSQVVDNLSLFVTTGTVPNPVDNPHVTVRWSDNLRTFGDPRLLSLKRQGDYGAPVRINRLGTMTYPGRLYEFATTDNLQVTISGAMFNVPLR